MGACVSVHPSIRSKTEHRVVIPSPIKPILNSERAIAGDGLKSQWSPTPPVRTVRNSVSKDEVFFDSLPWLDSDCEDDFVSVNGDFTPSRGGTPVHQSIPSGAPQLDLALLNDKISCSKPDLCPITKKKKLAELFRETGDQDFDDQNLIPCVPGANSVCSSGRTPNGDCRPEKERPIKSPRCCLPRIRSIGSFQVRQKKKMSPAPNNG